MLRYFILDVFTDRALTGNPLAVILDAGNLATETMQAVAREFNLSDTIFLTAPLSQRVSVRIFTPKSEVPFAGHPVIGAAWLVASLISDGGEREIVLEGSAGLIHCDAAVDEGWASFQSPKLPAEMQHTFAIDRLAELLGIPRKAIGVGEHKPSIFGAGLEIAFVPVANAETLAQILIAPELWEEVFPTPLPRLLAAYTQIYNRSHQYCARVFAPLLGTVEDPATGAAAAAFAGVLSRFERLENGLHLVEILQGREMARPSRIDLAIVIQNGRVTKVTVKGQAVILAEGTLRIQ